MAQQLQIPEQTRLIEQLAAHIRAELHTQEPVLGVPKQRQQRIQETPAPYETVSLSPAERRNRIRKAQAKYGKFLSSSEEFALHKQEEIDLEEQRYAGA